MFLVSLLSPALSHHPPLNSDAQAFQPTPTSHIKGSQIDILVPHHQDKYARQTAKIPMPLTPHNNPHPPTHTPILPRHQAPNLQRPSHLRPRPPHNRRHPPQAQRMPSSITAPPHPLKRHRNPIPLLNRLQSSPLPAPAKHRPRQLPLPLQLTAQQPALP